MKYEESEGPWNYAGSGGLQLWKFEESEGSWNCAGLGGPWRRDAESEGSWNCAGSEEP